jgi:hypothetical protein
MSHFVLRVAVGRLASFHLVHILMSTIRYCCANESQSLFASAFLSPNRVPWLFGLRDSQLDSDAMLSRVKEHDNGKRMRRAP